MSTPLYFLSQKQQKNDSKKIGASRKKHQPRQQNLHTKSRSQLTATGTLSNTVTNLTPYSASKAPFF